MVARGTALYEFALRSDALRSSYYSTLSHYECLYIPRRFTATLGHRRQRSEDVFNHTSRDRSHCCGTTVDQSMMYSRPDFPATSMQHCRQAPFLTTPGNGLIIANSRRPSFANVGNTLNLNVSSPTPESRLRM